MRILIVEDNVRLASLIHERLGVRDIHCDIANSLGQASEHLAVSTYDAILLDLGMPDGDGLVWLGQLVPARPPVLILSARGTLDNRVAGLDGGADDYLVKPADAKEIAARLRAILRRPGDRDPVEIVHQGMVFDTVSRQFSIAGKHLQLGGKEAELIELLMRHAGQVVPRERLEAAIYGAQEAVTPNALEAVISRMRRKLTDISTDEILHTVRGVGYILNHKES